MPTSPWSVTKLRLWAFIEVPLPGYTPPPGPFPVLPEFVVEYPARGALTAKSYTRVVHLDVVGFQSDWDLNAIPTGSVQVAIGRRADNTENVSLIHELVDNLKVMLRCQVWMHVAERSNYLDEGEAYDPWPQKPFVCFDGYACGTGFRQMRSTNGNEAGLRLDLVHWLADLNFSNSMSRSSHPINPSQYSFPAAFQQGAGVLPRFIATHMGVLHFTSIKATADFWGLSLMPWLKELTRLDRFNAAEVPQIASDPFRGANFEAMRSLARMEPFNVTHDPKPGAEPEYTYGVPLELDRGTLEAEAAARAMANSVGAETIDSMTSHTMWDKLASQYAPHYLLTVVPMVDRALVVPFIPGLRTWYKTIYAEEHDAADLSAQLIRPLRGVGIFTGLISLTGAVPTQPREVPTSPDLVEKIGGYYENREMRGGMVMFKRGPNWLTNLLVPYVWGEQAAAPKGTRGMSTAPGAGAPPARPKPNVTKAQATYMWQRYAQSMYIVEVLRGRGGTLRSRLRFDIAPGSSVRVVTANERFVSNQLEAPGTENLFGSVIRVSVVANSESMQAGTVFHIAYTRSANENISPSFSTYRHPLWANVWDGAPLIGNQPEFNEPKTGGRLLGEDDPEVIQSPWLLGSVVPRLLRPPRS